jgi:hypothetical protein
MILGKGSESKEASEKALGEPIDAEMSFYVARKLGYEG